ncbi:MAG: hypothetical protein ABFR82_13580 [Nitrospirota bacterium]
MTPGGLWDSSKYKIKALVKHKGKITGTVDMKFAGPSTFKGMASVSEKGTYEIMVYAYDPQTGNTGVNKTTVTVN